MLSYLEKLVQDTGKPKKADIRDWVTESAYNAVSFYIAHTKKDATLLSSNERS